LTSFTSLAKIEQWYKENLARHLYTRHSHSDRNNKASAIHGLALFMCFVAEDSPVRNMSAI